MWLTKHKGILPLMDSSCTWEMVCFSWLNIPCISSGFNHGLKNGCRNGYHRMLLVKWLMDLSCTWLDRDDWKGFANLVDLIKTRWIWDMMRFRASMIQVCLRTDVLLMVKWYIFLSRDTLICEFKNIDKHEWTSMEVTGMLTHEWKPRVSLWLA